MQAVNGLGAILEQHGTEENWRPIAYASRSLAPAEYNYAPIEKETLGIVFSCERFNSYGYGKSFTAVKDHQPLKAVFSRSITECPPRIQRFMLRLQKYDFDIEYVSGKKMFVSDALSRAHETDATSEIPELEMQYYVHLIVSNLPVSDRRWKQFQSETGKDPALKKLIDYAINGWTSTVDAVDPSVKPYLSKISYYDKVLRKGQRIIVPSKLRDEMKQVLHHGHVGIEKTKRNARNSLYLPNINAEITNMISNCSACIEHRNNQARETLVQHEVPSSARVKAGTDLFTLFNKDDVIVVDYYSKFFEISLIPDKESSTVTVITHVKTIFSRHAIPKEVISDNGPEFSSCELSTFAIKRMGLSSQPIESKVPSVKWFSGKDYTNSEKEP